MHLLSAPKQKSLRERILKFSFWKHEISKKRSRYISASLLDIACIILIAIFGAGPAQQIIPPLVSPLLTMQNITQHKTTEEVFAFAPGLSDNKYDDIDFQGLDILSFFDVQINSDGSLNKEGANYEAFKSERAEELFETAHYFKTKVLLTITAGKYSLIEDILNSKESQETLIADVTQEVKDAGLDGVTINFEYNGNASNFSRKEFAGFIANLSEKMHQEIPGSLVTVAVASNVSKENGLFDLVAISKASDKVLVMAYDFTVPESKNGKPINPVFGYKEDEYFAKVSQVINDFSVKVPEKKLSLERAWYGNGNQYPLYTPSTSLPDEEEKEPSHVLLDSEAVDRLVAHVPSKARNSARQNIPYIGKALDGEGILDSNVLAYALATIEHETAETFEPIDEIQGRLHARRLGYEGGTAFFGRGFIQLTHLRNYKAIGQRIGVGDALVKDPTLASSPEIAAKVLAAFFKDNNIANLASKGNFVAARRPVNPDRNGTRIALLAQKYWEAE